LKMWSREEEESLAKVLDKVSSCLKRSKAAAVKSVWRTFWGLSRSGLVFSKKQERAKPSKVSIH